MSTKCWVEIVHSDDITQKPIREGAYEQGLLAIILNCKTLDLFEVESNYVIEEVTYLEGNGVGEATHKIRIYVRQPGEPIKPCPCCGYPTKPCKESIEK
ncbi:hypothetical protein ACTQHI_28760 (plasmid) [Bacillus cereus]|uniref:hypothetical protein n=1 Tax=Bacillus cereus TaxID=1396 RepID=UPI003F918B93